jgi:predicted transcriptional regulator
MLLKEEQFKVLKTLVEATGRMDLAAFAQKVNLTTDQTIHQIQELAKEGFLQKVGSGGYGITQKGKAAIKVFTFVPKEAVFHFYYGVDRPSECTAESLKQFYEDIKQVNVESIEFHLYRGDFGNWFKEVFKDPEFTNELDRLKTNGLRGEDLRAELLKVLDAKYGLDRFI